MQCLDSWIAQAEHEQAHFQCPLCRQQVCGIFYNCTDDAHDYRSFASTSNSIVSGSAGGSAKDRVLTATQRARRRAYARDIHTVAEVCQSVVDARRPSASCKQHWLKLGKGADAVDHSAACVSAIQQSRSASRRASDRSLEAWLLREVQALTLDEQPSHTVAVRSKLLLWHVLL